MSELDDLLRYVDETDTSKKHRETIKKFVEQDFADHVITEEAPGVFRCAKPGTIVYSFRVAFLPAGMIVIYGDIGDMMIQRGGEGWLKSAIRHDYVSDYVFEKAVPFRRWQHKDFLTGEAIEELRRLHDGEPCTGVENPDPEDRDDWDAFPNPEMATKIAADWLMCDSSGQDAEAWSRAYYEYTNDCEYPDCRDYSSNDLWCYMALSWFVRNKE